MSLFYTACIETEFDFRSFEKAILSIMPNILSTDNINDVLSVNSEFFLLHFDDKQNSVKNRSKEYGMNFTYELWFDIHYSNPDWKLAFYQFIGKLLRLFNGDFVLEYNGDTAQIIRKDGVVTIDDTKISGDKQTLFNALGVKYRLGRIQ